MQAMKIWLAEYAMFHHHLFMVKHLDENKHYIITCRRGCPRTVHARKGKDGSWRITSVVQPHTCLMNVNIIKNCTLMTLVTLIEVVMVVWGC
jgi:hypothetical protein